MHIPKWEKKVNLKGLILHGFNSVKIYNGKSC